MTIIYNIVLLILTVLLSPVILIALIIQPKFRAGFFEKIGFYRFCQKGEKTVVFHAVSVGETNAIKDTVKAYKEKYPEKLIVVTTTTKTGQEIARKIFADIAVKVTYYPFDFFFSVNSFFNTFNPEKVIIAETEIWPGFVCEAKKRNIKVYTVNGRISPHSYNGYKKIKFLLSPVLNKYEKILMQSEDDAKRIKDIGADASKTFVMGNLKFDIAKNLSEEEILKYKNELKTGNYRVFIAASTHKGEDEIVIEAFKKLKTVAPDAKLLLVPRHPQRYDDVCKLLDKSGFSYGKRSLAADFENNEIILLDTMGELAKLFSVCYMAFIGGSFSQTGGHNPLEAGIWDKPVISGPSVFNFKDVYKIVTEKKCAVVVNDEDEFSRELISFYTDREKYKNCCNNAGYVFNENKGALYRLLEAVG